MWALLYFSVNVVDLDVCCFIFSLMWYIRAATHHIYGKIKHGQAEPTDYLQIWP
jgi:hypothetical protein